MHGDSTFAARVGGRRRSMRMDPLVEVVADFPRAQDAPARGYALLPARAGRRSVGARERRVESELLARGVIAACVATADAWYAIERHDLPH